MIAKIKNKEKSSVTRVDDVDGFLLDPSWESETLQELVRRDMTQSNQSKRPVSLLHHELDSVYWFEDSEEVTSRDVL